ncbi:hypothetical protein [Pontibacter sp. G13]|uniref:hypothetical protein n=1 Tax=Pontibacter sp. G13 TaxID=3074898 RepID=UPI00288B0CF6|nr:hypothetical protein [Pontibacter sp. G13]WNJ17909.1 hypothetical protein RJD25_23900 [Pontibacter sp. G13]
MKRTGMLLAWIATFGLMAMQTSSEMPPKLSQGDLSNLYSEGLAHSYEYMFSETGPKTEIAGKWYGTYMGGMKGLLLYTQLKSAVANHLREEGKVQGAIPTDFSNLTAYAQLAGGIEPFTNSNENFDGWGKRVDGQAAFHYYNPAIVQWGIQNMIPKANTEIAGKPAQEIYDRMFSRFFRMMVDTYLYINLVGYQEAQDDYQARFVNMAFDAKDFLGTKYHNALPAYSKGVNNWGSLTPQLAIGFWLRRGIDGTNELFWEGLSKIMQEFDEEWFAEKWKPGEMAKSY